MQIGRFDTLNFKQGLRSIEEIMALMVISKGALPVTTRGKTGTLSVSVRSNGQIGFSTSGGKVFDGVMNCVIAWDKDTREMTFIPVADPSKPPKGFKAVDIFPVGKSKNDQRYISAAGVFQLADVGYDFRAAGTHSFSAAIDGGKLKYLLPESMEPKPATPRKSKKAAAAGAGASPALSSPAPAAPAPVVGEEEELELQQV
jgi:hypothetical protein